MIKKTLTILFFLFAAISFSQTICTSFNPANFVFNGNAVVTNSPEVTLTIDQGNLFGTMWSNQEILFNEDFLIESELFFGLNDWGADGIAFVLQPQSSNAGGLGGGIGYAGISPSIAIEFDTYYNSGSDPLTNDHVAIIKNGQPFLLGPHSEFITPIDIGNVENGQWHTATFEWTANTQKLKLIFDGVQLFDVTIDLASIFPSNNSVFWGFTSATGGANNLHKLKVNNYCVTLETNNSNCCTNISSLNNNQTLLNTYYPPQENQIITPGSTSIILDAVPSVDIYGNSFGDTPIHAGDLLLIIQAQGANYNSSNSTNYGSGLPNSGIDNLGATGYTDLENTGNYEYVIALNDVPLSGGILQINGSCNGGIQDTYQNILSTSSSIIKRFQVIRVPRFQNLTLNSNIETTAWNGKVGGVIAFVVSEDLNLNGYTINASGKGFRGGYQNVRPSGSSSNIITTTNNTLSSGKGEGISGTPRFMWNGINAVDYGINWIGYMGGDYGRGAAGNAGGGGNIHNAGGGGGGNGGYGGVGGNGHVGSGGNTVFPIGGRMGGFIPFQPNKIIMGGGGGGGDANNATTGVKGGPGGGIIILQANKINGSGQIISNGLAGEAGIFFGAPDGAGGGGAGGSIMILTDEPSPSANLVIEVKGGKGGNTLNDLGDPHGPGGGGGGGILMHNIQGANLNIVNTGGLNGLSGNGSGEAHGSSPGQTGLTVQFNQNNIPDLVIDLYPNPMSNFTVNNICLGEIFQPVNTSNVSVLSSSTLVSYNWNFGDGTTSTLMNPIHVYNSVGNYTISLEVTTNWGCKNIHSETITVNPSITPIFNPVTPICSGTSLNPLPTTSNNGINGTWSPILNNTATTTYTFTPIAGQCATSQTMTITVDPLITPTFNQISSICSGANISALPINSTNGISGTWSPALNNTVTTTYTFTPTAEQCASSQIMTITVDPLITPTFNQIARICKGTILSALPTNSNNGISGTWSPELNNNITTTYTFTPDSNQCASNFEMIIDVFDINTYPIPKGISPNGDGKNENWDLISIDVITLKLYNRYGQLVYEKKNYTNEWFGQNNNSQSLPDGTYFYELHLECGTKTGWVYINK
jgi:gliding motility-associated-like protein